MTNWKMEHCGNVRPLELDTTSSPTTVYERRNIHEETYTFEEEEKTEWVCEMRTYTREEYELLNSPTMQTIMQQLSSIELQIAELGD